jgi:hypothetical protein
MANKVAYHNTVIDTAGTGTLATITVYNPGTLTASTIYSTPAGAAQANPFATDANGRFVFYADPGEYDINVSGAGIVAYTLSNVSVIGLFTQFVRSDPPPGDRKIKKIRYDSTDKIVVVYDTVPEP